VVPLVVLAIVVALFFDYSGGIHDANSIATVVATRVLRPSYAGLWFERWSHLAGLNC
jgi:PiT family inorganic phosphate transporter